MRHFSGLLDKKVLEDYDSNMSKIKTFFYVLARSFTSPSYYADVVKTSFWFSFKFFYFYFFLYSVAGTILFSLVAIPKINKYVDFFSKNIDTLYPQELVVKIQNGEVSTNVSEPYIISLFDFKRIFDEMRVLGAKTPDLVNLLVIDTKASVDDFTRLQTYALLTKDKFIVYDDKGGYRVYPLTDVSNVVIDKDLAMQITSAVKPFFKWVTPLAIIGIFILLFAFIPSEVMTYLIFGAFVLWIAGKMLSYPLPYKKFYQIGLHLSLIPTTVFGIISLFGGNVSFPFLRTIILTIMGIIVLLEMKKKEPITSTPKPAEKN